MPKPPRCRSMTEQKPMQRIRLAPDYEISRVIRGGWQLASDHGAVKSDDPVADMVAFADAGITTFDCADIYTGVEETIGRFRLRYRDLRGEEALGRIKVHTKFVPDLDVAEAHHQELRGRRHRPVPAAAQARPARPGAVPLVGLCRAALAGSRPVAERAAARRQDPQGQRDQFRHRPHVAHGEWRCATDIDAGAVFAAGRSPRQAHGKGCG